MGNSRYTFKISSIQLGFVFLCTSAFAQPVELVQSVPQQTELRAKHTI